MNGLDYAEAPNTELLSALAGRLAAERLVRRYQRLSDLSQASFDELQRIKGIGKGKAAAIKSAFVLSQRLARERFPEAPLLDTPERIADLLREENRAYTVENFQVVCLNSRRRLIGVQNVSQGTLDMVHVHPREVFRTALARNASAIVLVHNHPSGDPSPSEADIRVTRDLVRAGQLMRIEVLDHVILGRPTVEQPRDYASLREMGYFHQ